jgi:cytidine deaminase
VRAKTTKGNDWEALSAAARRVRKRAYAPHSGLHVGAALLGRKGGIFAGCNVENASLGLTICAEQSALFRAIAEGEREFAALAIYTPDREPLSPCGACRQVLAEFAPDLCILSVGRGGKRVGFHLRELLPHAFDLPPRPLDEQESAS